MRIPVAWIGALSVAAALSLPAVAASTPSAPPNLSGADFTAQLMTTVNSRDATVGEQVNATTLIAVKRDHEVLLPKGSELLGTVTNVNPGNGRAGATLSVAFTTAVMPNGERIPLRAGITGFDTATGAGVPSHVTIDSNSLTGQSTITRTSGNVELKKGQRVDIHDAGAPWNS